MGQTDCGTTTNDNEILPNRVLVEAPILRVDTNGNEREEPYIVSFNWEATSAGGFTPGDASYDFRGVNQGPWPYRHNAESGERALIGEDVGKADLHFPEVPADSSEIAFNHVKIAGLTMCAFEADDLGGQASFKTEVERFAVSLRSGLKSAYSTQTFGDDSTRAAFRNVYQSLISDARTAWLALDADQRQETEPLYSAILNQLANAIEMLDIQDKGIRPKIGAGTILGYVGTAFKVLPNLISLFKKKRNPDPDDFVGCASIIYVGVPFDVWNAQEASGIATCTAGTGGGQELAICAINEEGPTTLVFAPPLDDDEPNRRWFARLEVRRGNSPFDENGELALRRSAYRYATVGAGAAETVSMPDVEGPSRLCGAGVTGECRIHFAHAVNYETHKRNRLSYEILEKPANNYEIKVQGDSPAASVGVRLSTLVLPDYVHVHRDIVELDASGNGDTADVAYVLAPAGWTPSNGIYISEILSFQQQGGLHSGINLTISEDKFSPFAKEESVRIGLQRLRPANAIGLLDVSGESRATVRVTFIHWDDASKVKLSRAGVFSDDHDGSPPEEPEFTEIDWFQPFAPQHTSATLYYPEAFSSDRVSEAAYSLRAVGAEVLDLDSPKIRLYAQDSYNGGADGSVTRVLGRVINIRLE